MPRTLPHPRPGVLGSWDRLVGPGMTAGENVLVIGVSLVSAVLVGLHLASLGLNWVRIAVGSFIAFDVVGGAVCNMTETSKRWYHRAGQTAKHHVAFIGLHVLHIALVAWLFRGTEFDLLYVTVLGGWIVVSAIVVTTIPAWLKQPMATTLYVVALAFVLYLVGPTPGLEWFGPLLFIKLLLGHAVPPRLA